MFVFLYKKKTDGDERLNVHILLENVNKLSEDLDKIKSCPHENLFILCCAKFKLFLKRIKKEIYYRKFSIITIRPLYF